MLEDKSIGDFPSWFDNLGQQPILGPLTLSIIIFFIGFVIALIVLQYSGFGRTCM